MDTYKVLENLQDISVIQLWFAFHVLLIYLNHINFFPFQGKVASVALAKEVGRVFSWN